MKTDPGIEPTREARKEISLAAGHDAGKLVEHYIELQKRYSKRLRKPKVEQAVGADT